MNVFIVTLRHDRTHKKLRIVAIADCNLDALDQAFGEIGKLPRAGQPRDYTAIETEVYNPKLS